MTELNLKACLKISRSQEIAESNLKTNEHPSENYPPSHRYQQASIKLSYRQEPLTRL